MKHLYKFVFTFALVWLVLWLVEHDPSPALLIGAATFGGVLVSAAFDLYTRLRRRGRGCDR